MGSKRVLVVGAAGDVGQGIVAEALQSGWRVIAAGRTKERLEALNALGGGAQLATVVGDLGSEAGAAALWTAAEACFEGIDAVVVAVNAPNLSQPLVQWSSSGLTELFGTNLFPHFIAAKTFLPHLDAGGLIIGIGGGTADFIIPGMTQLSMVQAALRMMYRGLARECRDSKVAIRELMIVSMVNGKSKRANADPAWITDSEVGRHVCAIIADPARFPGPILTLKTKEQVGQPDVAA